MTSEPGSYKPRRVSVAFLDHYIAPKDADEAWGRMKAVEQIILDIERDVLKGTPEQIEAARWAVHYRRIEHRRLSRAYEDFRAEENRARRAAGLPTKHNKREGSDPELAKELARQRTEENERNRLAKEAWWTENGTTVARDAYALLSDVLRAHDILLSDEERQRLYTLSDTMKRLPRVVKKMKGDE